jgi:hypothetical protein
MQIGAADRGRCDLQDRVLYVATHRTQRGSRTKAMGSVSRRFVRLFAYVGRTRGE